MLKKKFPLLLLCLAWGMLASAESSVSNVEYKRKAANYFYEKEEYSKALDKYDELMEAGVLTDQELAQYAHLLLRKNEQAEALGVISKINELPPLGQTVALDCYMNQERYQSADSLLALYPGLVELEEGQTIQGLIATFPDRYNYYISRSDLSSSGSDFASVYCEDEIYFVSNRSGVSSMRSGSGMNSKGYQNIFIVDTSENTALCGDLNSNYNDGPMCFNEDGTVILMSRNSEQPSVFNVNKGGTNELKILRTYQKDDGEWVDFEELPFNSDTFSCSHPFIKDDRLYFSSDMGGGYGMTDLYYVEIDEYCNIVGEVTNMGPEINGPRRDGWPFVDENGTFFFTSNSHPGFGGLDVFKAREVDSVYQVRNLGNKVNTSADDFAFNMKNLREGMFTSNRKGGLGYDDLYKLLINPGIVQTKVTNKETNEPAKELAFTIIPNRGDTTVKATTDAEGYFKAEIDTPSFTVKVIVKDDYTYEDYEAVIDEDIDEMINFALVPRKVGISGKAFNQETQEVFADVKINITKEGEPYQELQPEDDGSYRLELMREQDYHLRATKAGFAPVEADFSTKNTIEWIAQDLAFVSDPDFVPEEIKEEPVLEPVEEPVEEPVVEPEFEEVFDTIFYALNKADVKQVYESKLNRIAEVLKLHPTAQVTLASHTDSRGSAIYNMALSKRRSVSAKRYLVKQGVEAKQIITKALGETMLLNSCGDDVECSEAQHDINRRTEISVTK